MPQEPQATTQRTLEDMLKSLTDMTAYPVVVTDGSTLTGQTTGRASGSGGGDASSIVDRALSNVLGGRTRVDDPAAFKAALARSFIRDTVDGRAGYRNVPRGVIAETVGADEVSGFQAALITHARTAVDHGLPLLDSLESIRGSSTDASAGRADTIKTIIRSSIHQLREEFERRDGPRPLVVKTQFATLFGKARRFDPDKVRGALGSLRDSLGLHAAGADTMDHERHVVGYRLLVENVVGMRTAWESARPLYDASSENAFLSVRIRRIELMAQTIVEAIAQVRWAMTSVSIGEAERRVRPITLLKTKMTVEELLEWAERTVSPDSITLIREGGRVAIGRSLLPRVRQIDDALDALLRARSSPTAGIGIPRVRAAWADLRNQWGDLEYELRRLAERRPASDGANKGDEVAEGAAARHEALAHESPSSMSEDSDEMQKSSDQAGPGREEKGTQ
jgi:hypothetical protein